MFRLITGLFRCNHMRKGVSTLTWPQSQRRPQGPSAPFQRAVKAHCTCNQCGCEFEVDPHTFKVGKRIFPPPHSSPTLDEQEAL